MSINKPVCSPAAPATASTRPRAAASPWRRLLPLLTIAPLIGLLLSGIITWINIGASDRFVQHWLHGFAVALPVMPLGLLVMGAAQKALGPWLARRLPAVAAQVLLAAVTAVVMELMMATVVTLSNRGAGPGFAQAWVQAFVKSLPMGFVVGLLMSFVIKPRLDRWLAGD